MTTKNAAVYLVSNGCRVFLFAAMGFVHSPFLSLCVCLFPMCCAQCTRHEHKQEWHQFTKWHFLLLKPIKLFLKNTCICLLKKLFFLVERKKTAGSDSIEMEQFRFVILIHQSVHNFVTWSISNANFKSILLSVVVVTPLILGHYTRFNNIKKRPIKKEFRRCNLI